MLISIAGSQGLGKSVFINYLQSTGIGIIERKTSRSILADWNVSLSEVNNDPDLTVKFQDEILTRKINDEHAAASDPDLLYVTERSYADLFSYALAAFGKDNKWASWFDQYYQRCVTAQSGYGGVLYLTREGRLNNTIVDDGVRSICSHYGIMIDETMKHFTKEMCKQAQVPLLVCTSPSKEERYEVFGVLSGICNSR